MKRFTEPLEARMLFASATASTATQLITAIDAANNSPGADTITLAAGATFSLTQPNNSTNGDTGLPVIRGEGGALSIIGNGAIIQPDVAGAVATFRIFDVAPGASLTLSNLTLQGGYASNGQTESRGGAIHNLGAVTLQSVTVQNNLAVGRSGSNGGWFGDYPALPASGGAIYSTGTLTIAGSTFRNNQATGGRGADRYLLVRNPGDGGIIDIPATAGANGSGGSIFVAGGSVAISGSTFTSNFARGGAGGSGSTPADGGSGYGGALCVAGGAVTILSTSITSNGAIGGAGGLGSLTRNGHRKDGRTGQGIGGGIYRSGGSLGLDDFTAAHTTNNTASTSSPNIAGSYQRLR